MCQFLHNIIVCMIIGWERICESESDSVSENTPLFPTAACAMLSGGIRPYVQTIGKFGNPFPISFYLKLHLRLVSFLKYDSYYVFDFVTGFRWLPTSRRPSAKSVSMWRWIPSLMFFEEVKKCQNLSNNKKLLLSIGGEVSLKLV